MLTLVIEDKEYFDEKKNEFFMVNGQTLQLEHSLVSASKWEAITHKPFITKEPKSTPDSILYIKCMTITQNVPDHIYRMISPEHIKIVDDYIGLSMTATTFVEEKDGKSNNEIITTELIYYWMFALTIPLECQKWHFNRLMTLIKVAQIKSSPAKKMSKQEIIARNKRLNEQRKKQYNTKG